MIVKSPKFLKFPKPVYMIVKNFRRLRRPVFQYYNILNDGKVVGKCFRELWPAAGAIFVNFDTNYREFLCKIHHFRAKIVHFFACGAPFLPVYMLVKIPKFLKILEPVYEGGSWDKFLRGGSGFPPCTQLGIRPRGPI